MDVGNVMSRALAMPSHGVMMRFMELAASVRTLHRPVGHVGHWHRRGAGPSARGYRKQVARAAFVERALSPRGRVINRLTRRERKAWQRFGKPEVDWVGIDREYRGGGGLAARHAS